MSTTEVLIVGAGPAGIAAALRLARAGVRVLVLEGAEYAGAENWSGCVYHADPLLRGDVLGPELWAAAPKERRITRRALFFHDGAAAAGFEARAHAGNDYGEAWTVLRPKIDRWLAARAIDAGATLLPATTVTGLRYRDGQVVGVHTERGNIDADVVFIAEGDAAGLLAREALERVDRPHYAQGIKAVFSLPPAEIERRFGVGPGEGTAQEWILRNGRHKGRALALNATAFLYTNHDTLSLGVVLPLAALATTLPTDHAQVLERIKQLAGIDGYLKDARQVAYGAKVIRAGGVGETPIWVRDGLAVGGGALGIGMEFPYPNFIGPAIVSALAFADGYLRLRERGEPSRAAPLEQEYAARLRATPEYDNAELLRHWPAAIHAGGLLFNDLPALLGQYADSARLTDVEARRQRQRALAQQLTRLQASLRQVLPLTRGMKLGAAGEEVAPLQVEFIAIDAQGRHTIARDRDALLPIVAGAIGHFYGRRLPSMRMRMALIVRLLRAHTLTLMARGTALLKDSTVGAWHLLGDLSAYKVRRIPLRALLLRPYHRHEESSQAALAWPLKSRPLSPTAWLAPMTRRQPDPRHIFLPTRLSNDAAQQLRHVCPAEVYTPTARWGGADSQHENCIKCESCRVTVPGIDWNRTSGHRLSYRVPGDGRYGFDASVVSAIDAALHTDVTAPTGAQWPALYRALQQRPAQVGPEWTAFYRDCLARSDASDTWLRSRLQQWLDRGAYGWMESELRAVLPLPAPARYQLAKAAYARAARAHAWDGLRTIFTPETLRALAARDWTAGERATLLQWIDQARLQRAEALTWMAQWAPALAWIAAQHYLAEDACGRNINDALTTVAARMEDGASNWLSGVATHIVDINGKSLSPPPTSAHGAGLDAARPLRYQLASDVPRFVLAGPWVETALCLARGSAQTLAQRARDYAAQRVQFRGDLRDSEGRDTIGKFGAIKTMLAGIAQTLRVLDLAQPHCVDAAPSVLNLIHARTGVRMDSVPWMAGQIFGGMAYSEEDILAPRYRDAMVLMQWPQPSGGDRDAARAFAEELLRAAGEMQPDVATESLLMFTRRRLSQPEIAPSLLTEYRDADAARPLRGQPLRWDASGKFAYRSGSFLNGRLLGDAEVLTPEHLRRDPILRSTRADVMRLLRSGFRSPDKGERYGHYIDRLHGIPPEDIARLRAFNAFATIAPERLGGKGWNKAQYAVLNTLTMGYGDTSLGLLIMASTSIGTMPVILGLEQDLPRLQHELNASLSDNRAWQELEHDLDVGRGMLLHPEPSKLKAQLTRIGERSRNMFMSPGSTLKYLARDYLVALQDMVQTAQARDLESLADKLEQCRKLLARTREIFIEEQSALPLRFAAHERFLRFLATGQISAFALTEPVAGSDTGGIQTRAVLRNVTVTPDAHGFYRFTPHGADETRVLLDAQRLIFEGRSVRYRLSDGALGTLDDSAWDMTRNVGERHIRHGGVIYRFDDIGTVLKQDGAWIYRYWEITGNKMWITNGSVCDRYALYAQTEFGECGFMVERRSEGLRIGPNENKLGQRASPTNELTFERVRVSIDQLIGFRGHGQVNALETLSVGRGGLVTGCATMVDRILTLYAPLWQAHPGERRAAQFELDRLQTLAARLVGLMDRADLSRGDFRIEAALSKYLASEGLHRVFAWMERIIGPMAASLEASIEKWRRDARILNIYEGTNEVQRFLVLKDLPGLFASFAKSAANTVENLALDGALHEFREFIAPHLQALGARVWQDPDLQARWFPVVEWVGELYTWAVLHERVAFLERRADPADRPTIRRLYYAMEQQRAYVARWAEYVKTEFDLAHQDRDGATAALGAARALLREPPVETAPHVVDRLAGDWAVVLRSRMEWNGTRAVWSGWNAADIAVLDRFLAWKDVHPDLCIHVVAVTPPDIDDHLRRLQATGVELLVVEQALGVDASDAVAQAVATRLAAVTRFAGGAMTGDEDDRRWLTRLAAALRARIVSNVSALSSRARGEWLANAQFEPHNLAHARRALFSWELKSDGRSDRFSVAAWLQTLRRELPKVRSDRTAPPLRPDIRAAGVEIPAQFEDPQALAAWLQARFAGTGRREPVARVLEQAVDSADIVWLTPMTRLNSLRQQPALRFIANLTHGRTQRASVLAYGAHGQAPQVSQYLPRQFSGVRYLTDGIAPPLAMQMATHLGACHYVVAQPDALDAAAMLAQALGYPLIAGITALEQDMLTLSSEGFAHDIPLPPKAVLVVAADYALPTLSDTVAAIAVERLRGDRTRLDALGRWSARDQTGGSGLAAAPLIIDVGIGVRDAQFFQEQVVPLQTRLQLLSGAAVEIGATRKITQELKLLPVSRQIGQTGIAVRPQLVLALGVSGAPQHMNWIAKGAIVVAINRDADAPIFRWAKEQGGPAIIRCVGDLRDWLPALHAALDADASGSVIAERQMRSATT